MSKLKLLWALVLLLGALLAVNVINLVPVTSFWNVDNTIGVILIIVGGYGYTRSNGRGR